MRPMMQQPVRQMRLLGSVYPLRLLILTMRPMGYLTINSLSLKSLMRPTRPPLFQTMLVSSVSLL